MALATRTEPGRPLSEWRLETSHRLFSEQWWEHRHRLVTDRARRQVPYYRDRWVVAGQAWREPIPVAAGDLAREEYRLCPLSRPWEPSREPSLWTGSPRVLGEALAAAGALPRRRPVLEVRAATVDWTRLAPFGNPYGVLLSPDARVAGAGNRRLALQLRALALAAASGAAVVVGSPTELEALLGGAGEFLESSTVRWSRVHRLTLGQAAAPDRVDVPVVVHDPMLGYVAARTPGCGEVHLLWTRVHCRASADGLLFTRIRGRRPTLVDVLPGDAGFSAVARCRRHGTPVLIP